MLTISDLPADEKIEASRRCAAIIKTLLEIDIPDSTVESCAETASDYLGIKEAYIYRDWQAAIGDMMIIETKSTPRRFDVIGFGEFEDRYLKIPKERDIERRWFVRLETLFHDLNMAQTSMFDARQQQLKNLQNNCETLEHYLLEKTADLDRVASPT